ncbi:Protein bric-a-brac 2 [Nymphon striatum]|nr:Protein bric-a-brac 2 [Nymphon striatum]
MNNHAEFGEDSLIKWEVNQLLSVIRDPQQIATKADWLETMQLLRPRLSTIRQTKEKCGSRSHRWGSAQKILCLKARSKHNSLFGCVLLPICIITMGSQQFCLRWSNYQSNLLTVFDDLLMSEAFVDCTLACEGTSLKAHKIVLSACSPFFQQLFKDNPCKHPIVIIKDITMENLKAIIHFMYRGEVNVTQDQLIHLLKAAETLRVKGLAELTVNQKNNETNIINPIVTTNIPTFTPSTVPIVTPQPLPAINLQQQIAQIIVPAAPVPDLTATATDNIQERESVRNEEENGKTARIKDETMSEDEVGSDENEMEENDSINLFSKLPSAPASAASSVDSKCSKEVIEDQPKSQGDDSNEFVDPSALVEQMLSVQMPPNLLGDESSKEESVNSPDSNSTLKSEHITKKVLKSNLQTRFDASKERKRQTAMYNSCPICHKEFANHNNYIARQHMSLHAQVPVIFTCDVCDKSFRWRNNLYVHRKKYHSGVPPPASHVNIVISESPSSTATVPSVLTYSRESSKSSKS